MASLTLPSSSSNTSVRVQLIDTTSYMTIKAESFIKPVVPGHELINVTDVSFLITHPSGKQILFDLGVRKDFWNLPTTILKRLGDVIPSIRVDDGVPEILQSKGINLSSIKAVIWSHYHWDHTGNMSLFPSSTDLVTGPGVKAQQPSILPGYPQNPKSPLSQSDFDNRTHTEVDFSSSPTIGDLKAFDYFGDGSFYLLDTPGHCVGHICGLARTTSNTFIFMGGDICHFAGDFRPSSSLPLPDPIPSGILDPARNLPSPCPCSLFTDHHPRTKDPSQARSSYWYEVTDHPRAAYIDVPLSRTSVSKMQKFDDDPNVLVMLAHDTTPLAVLPTFNQDPERDINDWQKQGWKERCHWGWLNELPKEDRHGKRVAGRKAIVEGIWKGGKDWTEGFERYREERIQNDEKGKL